MARFRKARKAFRRFGGFKRKSRSRSSGGGSVESWLMASAIYGVVRNPVAGMLDPLTSKLPSSVADIRGQLGNGLAGYLLAKKGSGLFKKVGTVAVISEVSSLVNAKAGNLISGTSQTASSTQGWA